jgi:hypothetical protein
MRGISPARRASIRRWCEQGLALMAEDASGPDGLLHGLDDGDPELFHLRPAARQPGPRDASRAGATG